MTTQTVGKSMALRVFETRELGNLMGYLAGRWADEFLYEDITIYGRTFVDEANNMGFKLESVKAFSRPFGVRVKAEGKVYDFKCTTTGRYSYKQVK